METGITLPFGKVMPFFARALAKMNTTPKFEMSNQNLADFSFLRRVFVARGGFYRRVQWSQTNSSAVKEVHHALPM